MLRVAALSNCYAPVALTLRSASAFIRVHLRFLVLHWVIVALTGCASDTPLNPSFPLTRKLAEAAIRQMENAPRALPRPVVVLGGIHDPGFAAPHIADVIRDTVPDRTRIIAVSFFEKCTFDSCVDKLLRKVDAAFPSEDPEQTVEVDVVAFSMGGVIARYAASDAYASVHGRRLRTARLFTISSPHQGADMADLPTFDQRVRDMREGSPFLARLNSEDGFEAESAATTRPHRYELFAYARLGDGVVGERHAAPPGQTPWWVPAGFTLAHILAGYDERILADILRRLRNEEPFSTLPAAPIPDT